MLDVPVDIGAQIEQDGDWQDVPVDLPPCALDLDVAELD